MLPEANTDRSRNCWKTVLQQTADIHKYKTELKKISNLLFLGQASLRSCSPTYPETFTDPLSWETPLFTPGASWTFSPLVPQIGCCGSQGPHPSAGACQLCKRWRKVHTPTLQLPLHTLSVSMEICLWHQFKPHSLDWLRHKCFFLLCRENNTGDTNFLHSCWKICHHHDVRSVSSMAIEQVSEEHSQAPGSFSSSCFLLCPLCGWGGDCQPFTGNHVLLAFADLPVP